MFTKGLKLPILIFGLVAAIFSDSQFAKAENSNDCHYNLILESIYTKRELSKKENLRIEVGLLANRSKRFFAMRVLAENKLVPTLAGEQLELISGATSFEINLGQIRELQKPAFVNATRGLQVNVFRDTSIVKQLAKDARSLFLLPGTGVLLLQEDNFIPPGMTAITGFDPSVTKFNEFGTSAFSVENKILKLNFAVSRSQNCSNHH